jgi:rhodanese-related sulfurtransferase
MPKALKDFVREALTQIREIAPEEGARLLAQPGHEGWHFVDVREPDEFAAGHLPGARNYPRGFLEVKADLEHPKRDAWLADRNRPLVLYCGGGHRSALAAKTLQEMGFTKVVSLAEGWTGWTKRGYAVERDRGSTEG